ncbi:hypothetical protein FPRO04_14686 [Fusarium proliferatum]|nr:hypothetical protein FPRO04_14686 [Fusarium proliferatum]
MPSPESQEEPCSSTPAATASSEEVESPAPPAPTGSYTYLASDGPILDVATNARANTLANTPESPIQTATKILVGLLTGLSAAIPSKPAASIADHCILLYTQYVFGTIPVCHEATVRATVGRFFIPLSDAASPADDNHARASRCFAADTERERIQALRNITLLTALCAAVSYVVPESLLAEKHLVAPLFLRAARKTLTIYQDYDLEHPDSSSLSIRLFLSSSIQTASGTHRVAFRILGEAGLIAMRMGLYDEELKGRNPIEETLLRNSFWQLTDSQGKIAEFYAVV